MPQTYTPEFKQRTTDITDGLTYQKIRLDEVAHGEKRMLRIEAIANPTIKSPEQIYIEQEMLHELYDALGQISEWEQTYLPYCYGFTDDMEHTLIRTAIHFFFIHATNAFDFLLI